MISTIPRGFVPLLGHDRALVDYHVSMTSNLTNMHMHIVFVLGVSLKRLLLILTLSHKRCTATRLECCTRRGARANFA